MEAPTALKVAKTSRAAIDSLENSKKEFRALLDNIDNEVQDLSQQVNISGTGGGTQTIERINKLKLHRRQLQDLLEEMEALDESSWEEMRPAAAQAYEEAARAEQ